MHISIHVNHTYMYAPTTYHINTCTPHTCIYREAHISYKYTRGREGSNLVLTNFPESDITDDIKADPEFFTPV